MNFRNFYGRLKGRTDQTLVLSALGIVGLEKGDRYKYLPSKVECNKAKKNGNGIDQRRRFAIRRAEVV